MTLREVSDWFAISSQESTIDVSGFSNGSHQIGKNYSVSKYKILPPIYYALNRKYQLDNSPVRMEPFSVRLFEAKARLGIRLGTNVPHE